MAHEIPYVATATVADLRDLEYKVKKAMGFRGARYIHILVPCPLGWGTASHDTIRCPVWPRRPGSSRCSKPSTAKSPVSLRSAAGAGRGVPAAAEALCPPLRQNAGVDTIARMQAMADKNIRKIRPARQGGELMDKPFAITLDPGSSLANHTGSWRTERPVYVDRLPPCNNQCPAGEDIQGWLFHAESGNYEKAWRI
jgi:hypothetical protein